MSRIVARLALVVALLVALLVAAGGGIALTGAANAAGQVVVVVGTSLENGTGLSAGQSWPSRLAARYAGTIHDRSLGGGAFTRNLSDGDNLRKHIDAAIAELHPNVLVIAGPVNDLVSLSDVTPLRWEVFNAVNAAKAAGVQRVLVTSIMPFTDGNGYAFPTGWWPTLEKRRTDYNSWAKAMYGANYVDQSPWLKETTTARGDRRWYFDGLHPSRIGSALIAETFPIELFG